MTAPTLLHVLLGAERGGCERNALVLMTHLTTARHVVLVVGPDGPMTADWRAAGAAVEVAPAGRLAAAVRAAVAAHRPAAAIVWHGLVRLPDLLRALVGVPKVAVHGGNPAHTMPRRVDWKFVLLGALFPAPRPLPTYICCSKYVADSFDTSRYLRRFPRAVVLNGVAPPPAGQRHTPLPLDPAGPVTIGMLARLDRIKDHPTLIRAYARVRERLPQAVLELAGDGDQADVLRHLAVQEGLGGAVRFLGRVADVYARMAGWDLFAYATTEREGLGNAVAEAMMFGLPCIVTEVGPTREFAGPDAAVRLVPPGDPAALAAAITELAADTPARAALAERGRRRAEAEFHPGVFAGRYARLLGLPARLAEPGRAHSLSGPPTRPLV